MHDGRCSPTPSRTAGERSAPRRSRGSAGAVWCPPLDRGSRGGPFSAMTMHRNPAADAAGQIDDVILSLCAERGPQKTICPTDAAKGVAQRNGGDELAWREALVPVLRAALRLPQ